MNQKERAINLGLKINSLKGNFSVAKSVRQELREEIENAVINDEDKNRLLDLFNKVEDELKSSVSPSSEKKGYFNQKVEDILKKIQYSKTYQEVDSIHGLIIGLEDELGSDKILKKEHKAAITHRISTIREKQRSKAGLFLHKNHDMLLREIKKNCELENPFHVSVSIKKYNDIVKKTPLFNDDRHALQAYLDTMWQKSSLEIKKIKSMEE